MEEKCQCREIMENFAGREIKSTICLSGCPESRDAQEYRSLRWWQKIFRVNPATHYNIHKQQTGTP